MKKTFVRHQQMKADTLAAILRALAAGATCKREIQMQAELSWGAVSENINRLTEREILVAGPDEPQNDHDGAGRKCSRWTFNAEAFLLLGLEPRHDRILTVLTDLGGKLLGRNEFRLRRELSNATLRTAIRQAVTAQLNIVRLPESAVIALAFSLTGAVDSVNRVWLQSSHVPRIQNADFAAVAADFPMLVRLAVEHDIFAKARATLAARRWTDENYAFLHLGDGIGLAVHHVHGFYRGSRGLAGEIGHLPCPLPSGPPRLCRCGQSNCLETFLSGPGLLAFAREKLRLNADSLPELRTLASTRQQEQLYQYLRPLLEYVCITASNLFDPSVMILGGELIEPWQARLEQELLPELQRYTWRQSPSALRFYAMDSCNSALGAALDAVGPTIDAIAGTIAG